MSLEHKVEVTLPYPACRKCPFAVATITVVKQNIEEGDTPKRISLACVAEGENATAVAIGLAQKPISDNTGDITSDKTFEYYEAVKIPQQHGTPPKFCPDLDKNHIF